MNQYSADHEVRSVAKRLNISHKQATAFVTWYYQKVLDLLNSWSDSLEGGQTRH